MEEIADKWKTDLACNVGILVGLMVLYSNSHVWFGVRVDGGGWGAGKGSPSFPLLWLTLTPLVQILFSPQPATTVKIKDGSYNFHKNNAEHLPPPLPLCSSLGINFVLSPAFHCSKIKEGSFVFTEIILSTHTSKLVLFCGLGQTFCRLGHATKLCKLEMINWWSMLYSTATCVRWIRFKGSVE